MAPDGPVSAMPATIRDVAAEAGVSTATVSRVINGSSRVAPGTRALVLKAIETCSFTARRRRAPKGRQANGVIAVRCPYVLTDYFGLIVSGVARSLRQYNKHLVLSADEKPGRGPSLYDLLLSDMTEGAILILPPEPGEALSELRARGYPFVVIDPRTPPPAEIAAVSAAHLSGARAVTEHLIDLGHRRIAVITGPPDWLATDGRLMGYRAALAAAGQLPPPEYVCSVKEPAVADGREAAQHLLGLRNCPTAVVAFNDKIAIGVMQAAAEKGVRVPRDLSVVGFDSSELGAVVSPSLTTVRQPLDEMARMGVELLIRLMEGRDIDTLHVELATEFVPGGSTAAPH